MKLYVKAFTLIELLVVVAIIGILAAVGVVAYSEYTNSAKKVKIESECKKVIKSVKTETALCELKNDTDYAFEASRGHGGWSHQMECQKLTNKNYTWLAGWDALQQHYDGMLSMTNLFDKNRPFINLNSNYNLDINYGSVHLYAQNQPCQVTFWCCLEKPCSNPNNIYSEKIVKSQLCR